MKTSQRLLKQTFNSDVQHLTEAATKSSVACCCSVVFNMHWAPFCKKSLFLCSGHQKLICSGYLGPGGLNTDSNSPIDGSLRLFNDSETLLKNKVDLTIKFYTLVLSLEDL